MRRAMIYLEGLRFHYPGGSEVVRLPEFRLAEGDSVLIAGPSGCGKTTLLHLIAGLVTPTAGRVVVAGQDLSRLSPPARDRFRGRHIGIVLQQFHLLPTLSALQNLLVAQHLAGRPVDRAAAHAMLAALGVGERPDAMPHQLSVGQQQRVAIARALVNHPQVLLADEPTSNLDDESAAAVALLLQEATRRHGASLVIATHDTRLKVRFANELALSRPAVPA